MQDLRPPLPVRRDPSPVLDEYNATGRILGKDTDEPEGYTFHGQWCGDGERPRPDHPPEGCGRRAALPTL